MNQAMKLALRAAGTTAVWLYRRTGGRIGGRICPGGLGRKAAASRACTPSTSTERSTADASVKRFTSSFGHSTSMPFTVNAPPSSGQSASTKQSAPFTSTFAPSSAVETREI